VYFRWINVQFSLSFLTHFQMAVLEILWISDRGLAVFLRLGSCMWNASPSIFPGGILLLSKRLRFSTKDLMLIIKIVSMKFNKP
jgi:hypothetical protein